MYEPLISIVIPVYNVEGYLRKSIGSICEQTYGNLQIIIVDDGSTDSSGAICDELATEDDRIEVVHTSNQGVSAARNEGMKRVKGKYILCVDPDDYIGKNHVTNFMTCVERYPEADLVITGPTRVFTGEKIENDAPLVTDIKKLSVDEALKTAVAIYNPQFSVHVWGKLYSKALLPLLELPEGKLYEDNYIFYKVICNASCILYENARDYFYLTDRETSITNIKTRNNIDELNAYVEMLPYVKEHAPSAYNAVYGNYAGRLIASYHLSKTLNEKERVDDLYQSILENRKAVRRIPDIPLSTRLAYMLTFLGKPLFDLAVNTHQRLLKANQARLKHKAVEQGSGSEHNDGEQINEK